jgi:prophage antirepressor-like protein
LVFGGFMNQVSVFSFDNSVVRTNLDPQGVPWFCARDVAEAIEHSKATVMLELVEENERKNFLLSTSTGANRETPFINESGLYRILFRSNMPKAKPFQDWLAKDVLPSIRRNGGYGVARSPIPAGADEAIRLMPAFLLAARACGLSDNQAQLAADSAIKKLTNNTIKPLELMGIVLLEEKKEQILTPTELVSLLGDANFKSARAVNILIAAKGLQRQLPNKTWEPTEAGRPYAELLPTGKKHSDGAPILQLKWRTSIIEILQTL